MKTEDRQDRLLIYAHLLQQVDYGSHFKEARKKAGLTQEEMSIAAGVSHDYISALERGKNAPTARILLAYALVSHQTVEQMLGVRGSSTLDAILSVAGSMTEKQKRLYLEIGHTILANGD